MQKLRSAIIFNELSLQGPVMMKLIINSLQNEIKNFHSFYSSFADKYDHVKDDKKIK